MVEHFCGNPKRPKWCRQTYVFDVAILPYTSKYLLRRCFRYVSGVQIPSQEVFGCLGLKTKNGFKGFEIRTTISGWQLFGKKRGICSKLLVHSHLYSHSAREKRAFLLPSLKLASEHESLVGCHPGRVGAVCLSGSQGV